MVEQRKWLLEVESTPGKNALKISQLSVISPTLWISKVQGPVH